MLITVTDLIDRDNVQEQMFDMINTIKYYLNCTEVENKKLGVDTFLLYGNIMAHFELCENPAQMWLVLTINTQENRFCAALGEFDHRDDSHDDDEIYTTEFLR